MGHPVNLNPCASSSGRRCSLIMASKPEKRVASSVFITLAPPRRDVAVTEEVGQAACEARHARPWETLAPTKTPGTGLSRNPNTWTPSGRTTVSLPTAPPQLSNGGKSDPKGDQDRDRTKARRKEQAPGYSFIQVSTVYRAHYGTQLPTPKSWLL